MPPKCILIAMGVLIVGSFLSGNASAKPLEPDDSEMIDLNSDYSSIDIDNISEEKKANDDETKDDVDEDIKNDNEVEYEEEVAEESKKESEEKSDNETEESEKKTDSETEESEEEETDKEEDEEEIDNDEASEENDEEDEEVTEKNEDDDKTIEKAEGKVLFDIDDGNDYVQIVHVPDEDDSQKETKSASWLFNLQYKMINMMKGIRDPSTPKVSKNGGVQKFSKAGERELE